MKLMRVKGDWILNWPTGILGPYEVPKRGTRGYVVDMDAPLEASMFCKGQEYKLEPAPAGATASPIDHPRAKVLLRDYREKNAPPKAEPKPSKPVQPDLPSVDLPKRSAAKA